MYKIEVDPKVLAALKQAFPQPERSAVRALEKYVRVLEAMLFESAQQGRRPDQLKLGTWSLSLSRLAQRGGQIGSGKTRVHGWLRENELELVSCVDRGSNLTGRVSDVRLTPLATLTDQMAVHDPTIVVGECGDLDDWGFSDGLDSEQDAALNEALCHHLYADLAGMTIEQARDAFDVLPVDLVSLASYVDWLKHDASQISAARKVAALTQARTVLAVAQHLDGDYLQRRKPSEFGRTYYHGVSIQNVNRELRRAILGDCWEYDIRSSVIAWKMGFAREYLASVGLSETDSVRREFPNTLCYLEDRDDFMVTVRRYVFTDPDEPTSAQFQTQLIKQAITAISFGARAASSGWPDGAGGITNSALVDILRNADQRRRFLADSCVRGFIREQNVLDQYIVGLVRDQRPDIYALPCLRTHSGRVSRAKVLAFLYQHSETQVMDVVRTVAARHGRESIANVHDAIFFRRALGFELKSEIEEQMREQTGNPYWRLASKPLEAYRPCVREDRAEVARHRAHIAREEEQARGYRPIYVTSHSEDHRVTRRSELRE
jgi:hypothetical protein